MNDNIRALGMDPVSPDAPCGCDVRYEDVYASLQQEMDKRSSPSSRDDFSWDTVASLSAAILRDQSKDLLVASYLAVALTHQHGGTGLEQGTGIMSDLLTTYWEKLFPPPNRVKGRIAALSWWMENTQSAMDSGAHHGSDHETVRKIRLNLETIDTFLTNRPELVNSLPPLGQVIRQIECPPEPMAPREKTLPPPERGTVGPALDKRFDQELADPLAVHKQLGPLFQRFRQAAKILHDHSPDNPQAYRWLRFAIWEPLTCLPASKDSVTRILPPPSQLMLHLETLERDQDWAGLVRASESALHSSRNLFLLDLNRLSHTALARMGPSFEIACRAVTEETRCFVLRLKGVEDLHFSDGSPFASEKTLDWLKEPEPSQDPVSGLSMAGAPDKETEQALARWKTHGDLQEAAVFFQDRINRSGSEKSALLYRLELFNILAASKKTPSAAAQAEAIIESMARHNLDSWDPDLAMTLLKTLHRGFRPCPDLKNRIKPNDLLVRMARIDAAQGIFF